MSQGKNEKVCKITYFFQIKVPGTFNDSKERFEVVSIPNELKQEEKCYNCNTTFPKFTIAKGFVYILSNPKMPNLFKVGFTRRSVE